MAPTDALDRSLNNSVRVTGLVFLPAIVAINIGLLLDPDRRTEPTSGRFIYALGLPGWIVDGAMALFFTGWTVLIIVGWVRERRRRRVDMPPTHRSPRDRGEDRRHAEESDAGEHG